MVASSHAGARTALAAKAAAVALPGTERHVLHARSSGREYHVMICRPAGSPPSAAGYPILYVLDANAVFGTVAETVGLRSRRPQVTDIVPAVVVGIGYATDEPLDPVRRSYDYTPPAALLRLPPRPDGTPWPRTGGADEFLDFIAQDLKPAIERGFPIDQSRQALFGHSFGGLFALHALFTRSQMFQSYIAASPSIWWNECFVLEEERAFAAAIRGKPQSLDVLITVGGCEQELVAAEAAAPDREQRAQWKRQNRMVDNARELADAPGSIGGARRAGNLQGIRGGGPPFGDTGRNQPSRQLCARARPLERCFRLSRNHGLAFLFEHDLFGKPVPTFPDHALEPLLARSSRSPCSIIGSSPRRRLGSSASPLACGRKKPSR